MGYDRMRKHLIKEREDLLDQARLFATGNAHRIETRDGELADVSEERLNIIVGQILDIAAILRDPDCRAQA